MVARRIDKQQRPARRPATTPKGREDQLISLAYDLAETQLSNGTASSQLITHFVKAGSERELLERKRLEAENLLMQARVERLESEARIEALYDEAIKAMRSYQGQQDESE